MHLRQGEQAENSHNIVNKRQHGTDAVLPVKAQPDIGHNAAHRRDDGHKPRDFQLLAHLRPDEFRTAVIDLALAEFGVQRVLHFLNGGLLRIGIAFLLRHADQEIIRRTEFLDRDIA